MDGSKRGNCTLSPGINCEENPKICSRCGWNPKVSEERLKRIKLERAEALRNGKG